MPPYVAILCLLLKNGYDFVTENWLRIRNHFSARISSKSRHAAISILAAATRRHVPGGESVWVACGHGFERAWRPRLRCQVGWAEPLAAAFAGRWIGPHQRCVVVFAVAWACALLWRAACNTIGLCAATCYNSSAARRAARAVALSWRSHWHCDGDVRACIHFVMISVTMRAVPLFNFTNQKMVTDS